MRVIFDLDHTLFDTAEFKSDLFAILLRSGASSGVILDTYREHIKASGGAYNFFLHSKLIRKEEKHFDMKMALERYEEFSQKNFEKYVNPETRKALLALKEKGFSLILLTKGGDETQRTKLRQSGMEPFFDDVYICQESKLGALKKIAPEEGDWFVDDSLPETEETKEIYPFLRFFLIASLDQNEKERLLVNRVNVLESPAELLRFTS